jgi:hypothetical protein
MMASSTSCGVARRWVGALVPGPKIPRCGYNGARRLPDGVNRRYAPGFGTWKALAQGAVMRIEEIFVGVLLVVAVASYGFVAAITLLT